MKAPSTNRSQRLVLLLFFVLLAPTMLTLPAAMAFQNLWLVRTCRRQLIRPPRGQKWIVNSGSTSCLTSSSRRPSARFTTVSSDKNDSADDSSLTTMTTTSSSQRQALLDDKLSALGIDATALHQAVQSTIANPTAGYDGTFGRSAIRTYRSFLYPKKSISSDVMDHAQLVGMASRTAQQIDFLLKRHQSHQQEWVRHHDVVATTEEQDRTVFPMIVLLDNLRSAFNVGSIFRTADATGAAQVITTGITPHPGGNGAEKVAKSALGAERVIPSRHFGTTAEAIAWLRQSFPHYQLLGLETTTKSRCYTDLDYPAAGVVIVLGNEVTGLDVAVMPLLDELLEIPMYGTKNSLNVASCAPIVLYEIVRQWEAKRNG